MCPVAPLADMPRGRNAEAVFSGEFRQGQAGRSISPKGKNLLSGEFCGVDFASLGSVFGGGQRSFQIPSVFKAVPNKPVMNAVVASPFRDGSRLSIDGGKAISARVVALLTQSAPPAIGGLVVPIVVDPVDGVAGRAWTHIGKEVSETVYPHGPSLANLDAPSAVARPVFVMPVVTARSHREPIAVLRGVRVASIGFHDSLGMQFKGWFH